LHIPIYHSREGEVVRSTGYAQTIDGNDLIRIVRDTVNIVVTRHGAIEDTSLAILAAGVELDAGKLGDDLPRFSNLQLFTRRAVYYLTDDRLLESHGEYFGELDPCKKWRMKVG
jgi:hypothetical protein